MIGILIFILIIGLVIGSFLNVVILRTVSEESIIYPGSKCPKCQTPLKWYHNIPLFSYLLLKGKCAFCHEHISLQYPLVELLSGIIFLTFGYIYLNPVINGFAPVSISIIMMITVLIASSLFIVISGTDIIEMKTSDLHTYTLMITGLIYSLIICFIEGFTENKFVFMPVIITLSATLIAYIFMELLRHGTNFTLKTETFGDGDSYIFAGVTAITVALFGNSNITFDLILIALLFIVSVISSAIFSLPMYLKNLVKKKNWYLLGLIMAFVFYSASYFYANSQGWLDNMAVLTIVTIILVVLGLALCNEILLGIKNKSEALSKIPFGPALTFGGLLVIIFLSILIDKF